MFLETLRIQFSSKAGSRSLQVLLGPQIGAKGRFGVKRGVLCFRQVRQSFEVPSGLVTVESELRRLQLMCRFFRKMVREVLAIFAPRGGKLPLGLYAWKHDSRIVTAMKSGVRIHPTPVRIGTLPRASAQLPNTIGGRSQTAEAPLQDILLTTL
jgi:hypothetical protein